MIDPFPDPLKSLYELIFVLPEPVLLYKDEWQTINAIGWSTFDILVRIEDTNGKTIADKCPLRNYVTHGQDVYAAIDRATLKCLWQTRPPESNIPAPEDKIFGRESPEYKASLPE